MKEWDINIYRGILTGYNDAFIIDGSIRNKLICQDAKSAEIIRPILRGRDVKRYNYQFADLYIIATFPSLHYDINEYPAVRDYLLSFGMERLEQTGAIHTINGAIIKSRKKTRNKWFETQDSISYWDDFSKQKIVWGNLCLSAQYAMVEAGMYINAPSPFIASDDYYLLAALNSKIADWYVRNLGVTRNGGYFEYKPMFVEQIPIAKNVDCHLKEKIIKAAYLLQHSRKECKNLLEMEQSINKCFYDIYELSDIEIKYIEK